MSVQKNEYNIFRQTIPDMIFAEIAGGQRSAYARSNLFGEHWPSIVVAFDQDLFRHMSRRSAPEILEIPVLTPTPGPVGDDSDHSLMPLHSGAVQG